MSMQVALCTPHDLDTAMRIISACIADMESRGIHQWDEIYPACEVVERDIRNQALFMATDNDSPRGIIAIDKNQSREYASVPWLFDEPEILVVHRLAVHPDHQRKGVATVLMRFAERRGIELGCTSIRLDAFVNNPGAVGLYEKLNYHRAGQVQFRKGAFSCYEKSLRKEDEVNCLSRRSQ